MRGELDGAAGAAPDLPTRRLALDLLTRCRPAAWRLIYLRAASWMMRRNAPAGRKRQHGNKDALETGEALLAPARNRRSRVGRKPASPGSRPKARGWRRGW